MQTSLKRLGFKFSTRKDMSAKFPRGGGGGANPFSAIRLLFIAVPNCRPNQFLCRSQRKCIPARWICDNQDDCYDNQEEQSLLCQSELLIRA